MTLHVTVVRKPRGSFDAAPTTSFEVTGPKGLTGAELGDMLADLGYADLWPAGGNRLVQLDQLPAEGMLTLTPFSRPPSPPHSSSEIWLVAIKGPDCGPHLLLTRGRYSIGRGDCDLATSDPALSRHHADIIVDKTSIALMETTGSVPTEHSAPIQKQRLLGADDEFSLGNTTFRICSIRTDGNEQSRNDRRTLWPPPPTRLSCPASGSRPWLMMATAGLPLLIGIVLALTMGSWFFLAFSAFGLVTGGVPATMELIARRRLRRRIRSLSADRICNVEHMVPPVGLQVLQGTVRAWATTPPRQQTGILHPLRLGSGNVTPPVILEPPSERGPQVIPVSGPVIITIAPGELGILSGPEPGLGPLVRSAVIQLSYACSLASSTLLIVGKGDSLPAEVRFMPCVRACNDVDEAITLVSGLCASSVVLVMFEVFGAERLAAAIRNIGDSLHPPALILTAPASDATADWGLDVTTSRLSRRGDEVLVALDGISSSTLSAACTAAQRELEFPAAGSPILDDVVQTSQGISTDRTPAWQSSSANSLLSHFGIWDGTPVSLDFVCDGPHVLVAGTTGSGKSELLKAMALDLVCRYGPDQLSLLLLDFKGGSTLGPYAETPHCQNLVTDLNAESGERVLGGLRVELQRRESIFREAKAEDYARYRSLADSAAEPLPRLLVIVDEFRVLSDELPDAVPELMRIATVGRSLGVHLLLATQRPQGVVTASMRANINTVIALRLLSPLDSNELLGTSAAAELSASSPGLGFMRRAGDPPLPFRSLPIEDDAPVWKVQEIGPGFQDCRPVATIHGTPPADSSPAGVLERRTADVPEPPFPVTSFAAPLPIELRFIPRRLRMQRPEGAIPLGLIDDIPRQRVTPLWWTPEHQRRLAVIAGPGSSAAATLLGLLNTLAREEPERHIYVLDGAGHFGSAAGSPRIAGFVPAGEPERVHELLDVFDAPPDAVGEPTATRILLVSGLAAWSTVLGVSDFASLDDRLAALARTTERENTCIIVTGDRDLTSSRFHALADHRLYLRFGLGQETVMGWPKLKNTGPYPGRAVWTSPVTDEQGVVVQLCTPATSTVYAQGPPAALPLRTCHPLPARVRADQMPSVNSGPGRYPIGLLAPDHRPWIWEPGRVGLILGDIGTGKTTLLSLLAAQLGSRVDARFSLGPLTDAPELLFLDDVLELNDADLVHLDALIRSGTHVVMSASPERGGLARLPPAARMLPPAAFLLLNPRQASDGDFPGWRLRPHQQAQPGRAVVMRHGTLSQVQCAIVDVGEGTGA